MPDSGPREVQYDVPINAEATPAGALKHRGLRLRRVFRRVSPVLRLHEGLFGATWRVSAFPLRVLAGFRRGFRLVGTLGKGALSFLQLHQWWFVGLAYAAGLALGFVGFAQLRGDYLEQQGRSMSLLDAFYRSLQLTVMEGGWVIPDRSSVPLPLQIARFLIPLVTGYAGIKALFALFREQVGELSIRILPHRVVVCGLGERGYLLARSLRARGQRVVVIEKDSNNELIELCRRAGAVVLIGDATDPQVLGRARIGTARHLIAVCREDRTNAEVAIRARALASRRESGTLACSVHVVDPQLCTLLKSHELSGARDERFRLDCFNVHDGGAHALLRSHPPFDESDSDVTEPHLAVVGLGRLGQSVVVQAARRWIATRKRSHQRLRVTVIDKHARGKTEALRARFPQLSPVCDLVPAEVDVGSPQFGLAEFLFDPHGHCDVSQVYVCMGDDSVGVMAALRLYRKLRGSKVPIVVRTARATSLASLLGSDSSLAEAGPLRPFGLLDEMCNPDVLLGGTYELLARATHEEYVRTQVEQGETTVSNPAMVPWDDLDRALKESNRAQASHIGTKLREVGCAVVPWSDWNADSFEFAVAEVEKLAEMEHARWVAERLRTGWSYAPSTKDLGKKTSPYLVPWDRLSDEVKEWDRVTIRGLPTFLAGAEFQIVRVRPPSGGSEVVLKEARSS